jgi:hypothetical protein
LLQNYFRLLLITPAVTLPDFEKYLNSLIPRFKPGGVVEDAAISAAASCENYAHVSTMSPLFTIEGLLSGALMRSFSNQSQFTQFTAEVLIDDPDFEFFLRIGEKGATIHCLRNSQFPKNTDGY